MTTSLMTRATLATVALAAVSLVARSWTDPDAAVVDAAADLVRRAAQWRDATAQDTDPALRLQHAATALAYIHAARALAHDASLERRTGVSVARLTRSAERAVVRARQSVRPDVVAA